MKQTLNKIFLLVICLFLLFLTFCCSTKKVDVKQSESIYNTIIGTWICRAHGGYAEYTYYEDGTAEGHGQVPIPELDKVISFSYKSTWRIDGGYIFEEITEISRQNVLKIGDIIEDKIVTFSENEIVLLSDDGYKHSHFRKK